MTTWTADHPIKTSGYVLEAAGGMFRTVLGSMNANELHVVLAADNPLCPLLAGEGAVRVMAADGRAFGARREEGGNPALGKDVLAAVAGRLTALQHAQGTPRLFRLVLDTVLGEEAGQTPRT